MNAQCYRVIFNKARGMLMVVSEAARAQGKTGNPAAGGSDISQVGGKSQSNSIYQGGKLNHLRSHLLLALGMVTIVSTSMSTQAHANDTRITADRSAAANQQAVVLATANGINQVNIQSPNAAGVSRNVFSQFDVGREGAVLNNSRVNTQTNLAGWIEGNPYMSRGEARIILNEVNSSDPSRLIGFTEIAGGTAELIIANPAGITCAGCGFINAQRTTLSTGQTLINQGSLTGFDVSTGTIRIDGDGMDNGIANYTQLIAKTTEINADIYAKSLDIINGSNQVSYETDAADTTITPTRASNNLASQKNTGVALDVSALGGMYAGKIRLIGTDKGMGVTNAGSIVSSALQLDYKGNLVNSGSLIANQGQVDIDANNYRASNSGTIASSQQDVTIDSSSLNNSGVINSYDTLSLRQAGAITNSGEMSTGSFDIQAAALNNTGKLLQTGSGTLQIDTQQLINQQGGIIGQDLYATTASTNAPTNTAPSSAPTSALGGSNIAGANPNTQTSTPPPASNHNGNINVGTLTNTGGGIYANGKIHAASDSVVNKGGSSLAISTLDMPDDSSLSNTDSRLRLDEINWQLANFDNSNGYISALYGITIKSDNDIINRQGVIAALGDINLSANNQFDNTQGIVQSDANIAIQSSNLDNTEGTISGQDNVTINADGNFINAQGLIYSGQDMNINTIDLDHETGRLNAQGKLNITANTLDNKGQIYGRLGSRIVLNEDLKNSGLIASNTYIDIQARNVEQTASGSLIAGMQSDGTLVNNTSNLTINSSGDVISRGQQIATNKIFISGNDIDFDNSVTQGGDVEITASTGDISTKEATVMASGTLLLNSTQGSINNQKGDISAGALNVQSLRLNNSDGILTQTGRQGFTLNVTDRIDNTRGRLAGNANTMVIDTNILDNNNGNITHAASVTSTLAINANRMMNQRGQVLSLGDQIWQVTDNIDNVDGVIQAKRFDIKAGSLNNTDGRLLAVAPQNQTNAVAGNQTASQLQVTGKIINSETSTANSSAGSIAKGIISSDTGDLNISASELVNEQAQISSVDNITINTDSLTNSGSLYAHNTLGIINTGNIINTSSIAAQDDLTIKTGSLNQSADGQLIAGLAPTGVLNGSADLTIDSSGKQTNAGVNMASATVEMQGSTLDLSGGTTQGERIDLTADQSIINNKAQMMADEIRLQSQLIDNNAGFITTSSLAIDADTLNNLSGEIRHLGQSPLSLAINNINNQAGFIGSNATDFTIIADNINNQEGVIQHSGSGLFDITANQQLQGQKGQLVTANTMALQGQNIDLSNAITQAGAITVVAGNLNNQNGQILLTDKSKDSLLTVQQQLNNIGGRIVSQNQQLTIDGGNINTTTGEIFAEDKLTVLAENLNNTQGVLAARSDTSLTVKGQLNNTSGLISSQEALTLNASTLNNSNTLGKTDSGILANSIDIEIDTLINKAGLIEAKDPTNIVGSRLIDNTKGLIASGETLSIKDSNLGNRQLNITNTEGTLVAHTSNDITARSITGGSILSFKDISIDTSADFTPSGNLNANGDIAVKTEGSFINLGVVAAGNKVTILSDKDIINHNKIQSVQDLSLTANNIINSSNAQMLSNNNQIKAYSTLNNQGSIEGVSLLTLDAGGINNSGKLIANATGGQLNINADNTLQNTGLINAGQVVIRANELLNSEKIFGGEIAIQADKLVNGKDRTAALLNVNGGNNTGGAIASRGDLKLTGNHILNEEGALIYAQGDLQVGRRLDANNRVTGKAQLLTNASADINIVGSAYLNAIDVNNENRHLLTTMVTTQDPTEKMVFNEPLESTEYSADEIRLWRTWNKQDPNSTAYNEDATDFDWFNGIDRTKTFEAGWGIELPDGRKIDHHIDKRFKETTSKTTVVSSKPGSIVVGGNLVFSDSMTNKDSEIIIGGLVYSDSGKSIKNISTEGELLVRRDGDQTEYWIVRDSNGTFGSSRWESRTNKGIYTDSTRSTFDLDTSRVETNVNNAASQQNIEQTATSNNSTGSVPDNMGNQNQPSFVGNSAADAVGNVTGDNTSSDIKSLQNLVAQGQNIDQVNVGVNTTSTQSINNDNKNRVFIQDNSSLLPTNSLFGINSDSNADYIVEVDPAFSNHQKWLSSDYMLSRSQFDPTITQKRLGDGFYEQMLVQDQIHKLTGYRFLDNFQDDESQYQRLMENGLTFAQNYSIRPGIALTSAQIAQLTSDIVWLVEESITLDNGQSITALVPRVYLRPGGATIRPNGALISAQKGFNVTLSEDFDNLSGVVMGRDVMNITAKNINNISGSLLSDAIVLDAVEDINNIGGSVRAKNALLATAGADITIESTTQSSNNGKRTTFDRLAGFYVDDELKGRLQLNAGQNITLTGATINNAAKQGSTVVYAGKDINLGTLTTGFSESLYVDEDNQRNVKVSNERGSSITGAGDISLRADENINIRGSSIKSQQGAASLIAGQDVTVEHSNSTQDISANFSYEGGGLFSRTSNKNTASKSEQSVNTSSIEGDKVIIQAGRDISLTGTNAISDTGTSLSAGGNIDILAAQNTKTQSQSSQEKKSGLFGSDGGAGFTLGKQQSDDSNTSTELTHTASNVGAIDGNVIITAGGSYQQTGSNIIAGMGQDSSLDINDPNRGNTVIRAKSINIDNVLDVTTNQSETKFKQSGLTVSVSNSLVDSAKSINSLVDASGNTDSTRMKGMAAVAGALKAKALAAEADKAAQGLLDNGINADSLKGLGNTRIQATIGSQKSQSNSSSYTETNQASSIITNNLALIATGGGTDSNINVNGSRFDVTNNALFQADNDFNVNGVAQNSNTRSDNKSSSNAIGAYASTNAGQGASYGITASASRGEGYANSDSVTYANSQINVGGTTTFDIGNDVNIKGGVINTGSAQGVIGGNVNIESLQDTASYDSNQKNMGFSADIDLAKGTGSSLSLNGGKTDINTDYKAVGQQSGLFTGDGGFDLVVGGKTTLIGGAITTTEAAKLAGRNNYVSLGGYETQDIENTSSYKGDAIQVGVSLGNTTGKPQATMNGLGYGTDSDSQTSITKAGITGIAGNSGITTDNQAEYAGKLDNVFDANRVNEELGAQTQITQEFGKEAPKAVGDFAANRQLDLIEQGKVDEADKWAEGGTYRVALHTLVGAIATGSIEGALSSGTTAVSIPAVDKYLEEQGIDETTRDALLIGLSAATGAIVGGDTASTASSVNQTQNNFLSHKKRNELNKLLAKAENSKGKLSLNDSETLLYLIQYDQVTNILLEQYRKDPSSLNSKDLDFLAVALNDLVQEGGYDKQNAQILINGGSAAGYTTNNFLNKPKVADKVFKARGSFLKDPWNYLTYTRPTGVNEEIYNNALTASNINNRQKELSKLGGDAIYVSPGALGQALRGALAAKGVYDVGYGGAAIYDGNYKEGMVRVGAGVLEIVPAALYPNIRSNPNHPHNIVLERDIRGNEILYRTMSQSDFAKFQRTGKMPATGETYISPSRTYSSGYEGVLVQIKVKPGTMSKLAENGVAGNSGTVNKVFPNMPRSSKGWTQREQVQFKLEGQGKPNINSGQGVVNAGLGKGKALDNFNQSIVSFKTVKK